MKSKPDVSQFGKSNLEQEKFLENIGTGKVEKMSIETMPKAYVLKSFRLSWDVAKALKLHVAQKSVDTAIRVTETEIIEGLLREYLKVNR